MANSIFTQKIGGLSKRIRISRAQKVTLLEVGITALILGAAIMLIIFLVKYINLNSKAIGAKSQAINNYSQTIANVGICVDKNKDGKVSYDELQNCKPNEITLEMIPNTLQSNIMTKTAYDAALESVASNSVLASTCTDSNGKPIDFLEEYKKASTEVSKAKALESIKTCSALRIIPDALPAQQNVEGAIASLNWLLNKAGVRAESMAPNDNDSTVSATASKVDTIPISLTLETGTQDVYRALATIEKSIRTFDVNTMTLEWGGKGNNLSFSIKSNAYYSGQLTVQEQTRTVTSQGVRKGK